MPKTSINAGYASMAKSKIIVEALLTFLVFLLVVIHYRVYVCKLFIKGNVSIFFLFINNSICRYYPYEYVTFYCIMYGHRQHRGELPIEEPHAYN